MSHNLNMLLLRHGVNKAFISSSMNKAFYSCISSNLVQNVSYLNKFSSILLSKHLTVKKQTLLRTNTMSSINVSSNSSDDVSSNVSPTPNLTKQTANALVMKLTTEERTTLLNTLQQFESEQLKAEYKGQLAAFRWRSKFGRPSKVPGLGDVDPTGSYCPVPEDWLMKKYAETMPKPTGQQLFGVAVHNAIPFIGFGFLDNFLMIICGDYIELTLGSFMTLSTMAAAALGNTMGDVLGLGCAGTVESLAAKVGVKAPSLSPIQLNMKTSQMFANLGRSIGVTIGCLLGMLPLLFMNKEESKDKEKESTSNLKDS